jgi:hypothetical protein
MKSRRCIIVIEGFYRDPQAVRNYALRQDYYTPYQDEEAVTSGRLRASWWTSHFLQYGKCPFKSSQWLHQALENAVGERIDMKQWRAPFPVDPSSKPLSHLRDSTHSCLWNCSFHIKPETGQQLGEGVHNHVTDGWNAVGRDGWAGIIYLNPVAPLEGGLHLWRNVQPMKQYDWMTPAENWQLIDSFGNLFNRLVLVRGDSPHSGARGWGDAVENGRLYQTFFFRTIPVRTAWPVAIPKIGA